MDLKRQTRVSLQTRESFLLPMPRLLRGQRCGRRRLHLARVDTCAAKGGLREARVRSLPLRDQRLARQGGRPVAALLPTDGFAASTIDRARWPSCRGKTPRREDGVGAERDKLKKRTNIHALIHTEKAVEIPESAADQASAARGYHLGWACQARVQHRVSCAVAAPSAAIPTEPPACSPLKPADVVPADVVPCAAVLNRRVSRVVHARRCKRRTRWTSSNQFGARLQPSGGARRQLNRVRLPAFFFSLPVGACGCAGAGRCSARVSARELPSSRRTRTQ